MKKSIKLFAVSLSSKGRHNKRVCNLFGAGLIKFVIAIDVEGAKLKALRKLGLLLEIKDLKNLKAECDGLATDEQIKEDMQEMLAFRKEFESKEQESKTPVLTEKKFIGTQNDFLLSEHRNLVSKGYFYAALKLYRAMVNSKNKSVISLEIMDGNEELWQSGFASKVMEDDCPTMKKWWNTNYGFKVVFNKN